MEGLGGVTLHERSYMKESRVYLAILLAVPLLAAGIYAKRAFGQPNVVALTKLKEALVVWEGRDSLRLSPIGNTPAGLIPREPLPLLEALAEENEYAQLAQEVFDAIEAAARQCDPEMTRDEWLRKMEWLGGYAPRKRGFALVPVLPWSGASIFTEGWNLAYSDPLIIAVTPSECIASRKSVPVLRDNGEVGFVDLKSGESKQALELSRLFSRHSDDFRNGNVSVLAPLLQHESAFVRYEATLGLCRSPEVAAIPYLKGVVESGPSELRVAAAIACAELGDSSVEGYLLSLLPDDDKALAEARRPDLAVIIALGLLGVEEVMPRVKELASLPYDALNEQRGRAELRAKARAALSVLYRKEKAQGQ